MAQMIPPFVPRQCPSQGEVELYQRLRDDPGTSEWFVLHSLALASHERRVAGEIDFVVIIPEKGVLCLEVKGCSTHSLRRVGGVWYYASNDEGDSRGPFRQAAEGMHTLRRRLIKRHPELSGVLFASGVVFPYARFVESSVEWNEWEVVDSQMLRAHPISRVLTRLMDAAREHLSKARLAPVLESKGPSNAVCVIIRDELRRDFEVPSDHKAWSAAAQRELRHYTAEQMIALDAMDANPRAIFVGPAGTGKTLLAMEAARRAQADGKRVLFLCFNRLLGSWLAEQMASLRPNVLTETLHRRMLEVSAERVPESPDQSYWQDTLPLLACDSLLAMCAENEARYMCDELVVDEVQDLLTVKYLDFLDLSLRGGLGAGRWRVFGDFEHQSIYAWQAISLEEFRATRSGNAPLYLLRTNCRNTPLIAEWVHLLAGLTPSYSRVLRPNDGVRPRIKFYDDEPGQEEMLVSCFADLRAAGWGWEEIVVLSPRSDRMSAAARISATPWKDRLHPLGAPGKGGIRYGSIHAFKGLEAPAIVITDLETIGTPGTKALLYVGITRSLQRLVILAHSRVRAEALSILSKTALTDA